MCFLFSPNISFALHDWYEGYNLEPYWARSKSPLVVQFDEEHILDLQNNILVARGESSIFSFGLKNKGLIEDRAIENSIRSLIDAAKGLRLDSESKVSDIVKSNTALGKEIEKYVRSNYKTMHFRIFTMRGTLRVTSSVKYDGQNGLLSIVYPYLPTGEATNVEEIVEGSSESASLSAGLPAVGGQAGPTPESGVKGDYTGLIIDARKLKLVPAVYPRIVDDTGRVVCHGAVQYESSLDEANKQPEAGKNPMVIKAIGTRKNCDPVISRMDAIKILAENKTSSFLDGLGIIVLI